LAFGGTAPKVYLEQVNLANFRNYESVELALVPDGVTLLRGSNGAGKTNLLEAIAYLAVLRSFRGAPTAAMVRDGCNQAVVRAQGKRSGRSLLVEVELNMSGKDKVRLNRQPLRRSDELLGAVVVTVFSPDDIGIVKGPPQARRDYLDDLLSSLGPRHGAARSELDRVLKQRNALLRSAGGSLRPAMASVLDVWDTKLAAVGEDIARAREAVVASLSPQAEAAYAQLSGTSGVAGEGVVLRYERSWQGTLLGALGAAREEDVRRGATSLGPQRDELFVGLSGLAARVQASQGEQRGLALALRLGAHALVAERQGTSPVLLLDDIFSELDPLRSEALCRCLPDGQTVLTAAGVVPALLPVSSVQRVAAGELTGDR